MKPTAKKILVAASGTGGHLLPAVQIAKALRRLAPDITIEFIGSGRPLEEKLVGGAGFKRHVLRTVGLKGRGLRGILEFGFTLPRALWQVWEILRRERPAAVLGVGGYVSVLPVLLASLRRIPTWIHEAELKPGMANNLLSRFANTISVAFEGAAISGKSKVVYTGHPIREDLREIHLQRRAAQPKHLLVLGGSQGAAALDAAVPALGRLLAERGLAVRHQCRPENVEKVTSAYQSQGVAAAVVSFIEDMPEAYTWADIVICRAGAGTVMEIEAVNLPAIFVPYPFAQGNHQKANAQTLVDKGKAILVEEGEQFELRLRLALESLLDTDRYCSFIEKEVDMRSLNAAEEIARGLLALCR